MKTTVAERVAYKQRNRSKNLRVLVRRLSSRIDQGRETLKQIDCTLQRITQNENIFRATEKF